MPSDKPTIVIIPGAFHKPDNYRLIIRLLRSQGYDVLSVPLAVTGETVSASLDQHDDARALLAELVPIFDQDGGKEAILISHSYGSLVVAAAIEGQTTTERKARGLNGGVRAVINIAGFAFPARGKNVLGTDAATDPMPYWRIEVSKKNSKFKQTSQSIANFFFSGWNSYFAGRRQASPFCWPLTGGSR